MPVRLKEVVDNPDWCRESLDHALADGGELLLLTCRLYLVDFELDEVSNGNDHLSDYSLTVQHLKQVRKLGQRAGGRVKRFKVQGRVTAYS